MKRQLTRAMGTMMRERILLSAGLALLAAVGVAHAAESPGLRFEHGDWELACDNTRTCRAAGYHSTSGSDDEDAEAAGNGEPMPVSVLFTRKAGPNEAVRGEFQIGNPGADETTDQLPQRMTLAMTINGQAHGKVLIEQGKWTVDLAPAQTQALLAALTRSSRIAWSDGTRTWRLSDKGAAAVLLKMDEFQGRLGTPGALVRKGARDEKTVLPPLPAPVVVAVAVPRQDLVTWPKARLDALRAALKTQAEDCPVLTEPGESPNEIIVRRLSGGKLLASTLCWRGASNTGDAYWVINATPPYAPELVTSYGAGYDDGKIDGSQKGRGMGDCWAFEHWTWDGKRFIHTNLGNSGACNGIAPGGAWSLPTLVTTVRKPGG